MGTGQSSIHVVCDVGNAMVITTMPGAPLAVVVVVEILAGMLLLVFEPSQLVGVPTGRWTWRQDYHPSSRDKGNPNFLRVVLVDLSHASVGSAQIRK